MTLKMKSAAMGTLSLVAGALLASAATAADLALPMTGEAGMDGDVKLDTLDSGSTGMDHTLDTKVDATGTLGHSPLMGDAMAGSSGVLSEDAKPEVKGEMKAKLDAAKKDGKAAVSATAPGDATAAEPKGEEGISAEPEKLEDYMKDAAKPTDGSGEAGAESGLGGGMDVPMPPEGDDMMGNEAQGDM